MNRWRWFLVVGLALGAAGVSLAAQEAPSDPAPRKKSEPPQPPTHFTSLAQQYLEAAKARLSEQRQSEAERQRAHTREEAQRLAIQVAQQKLKQQTTRDRESQLQLKAERERQLKTLYAKGLALYGQGAYEEAVSVLQQLALIDPTHPLVKSAERLIARAELKRFEQRMRASAESPETHGASVPELEQLLTQKRMELETVFKYAKAALQERKYDTALKLLTAILVQDPTNRQAQQLIEDVHLARLTDERDRLKGVVRQDEEGMINDVLKAQIVPQVRQVPFATPRLLTDAPTDNTAMLAKLQEPISFEFSDVPLRDVIEFIADAANISIIPSPHLDLKTQRVSLKVSQLPLEQALKYLTQPLSLTYRVEPDAIRIATAEEFSKEPLQTRVFFLHNGLGPFALETAAIQPNPMLAAESIQHLVEQSVPKVPGSKFVTDERSGALIATNTGENLKAVERLLSQLDVAPLQVFVEARFVELTMTELEQQGLESVLNGNVALTKKGQGNGTRDAGNQLASGSGFKFPTLAREGEGLNFTLQGVLTGTQFESVLHFLEESKKSKTLSAPRVTTLNNQTAHMRVVDEFNYPTRYEVSLVQFDINGDGDFNDAGETEFVNVPRDFQKRDIGILLNVTPSVGKDLKTITLVLAPEVSQFTQFRDLGGGVTVPEFTSSQLTTSVVIADGQTAVLGGLMKDTTSEQTTKVPVLGDLPMVKNLFRQKETTSTRKNLLIFITARLLASHGKTT